MAWFLQRGSKAGIHRSKNNLCSGVFVVHVHYSYSAYNTEIFFLAVIQSREFAKHVKLLSSTHHSCKMLRLIMWTDTTAGNV
jgi:hypothetical protein